MIKQKENSLDLEFNAFIARLGKIKDMSKELHQDASNLLLRLNSLSKRKEISDEYKMAAEKANMKLLTKLQNAVRAMEQK